MDVKFPVIRYTGSFKQWGLSHGEEFRPAIQEWAKIRKETLKKYSKNFTEDFITEEGLRQWERNKDFDSDLHEELEGIAEGADVSIPDLVILNNFTDFKDIGHDEGCSTVYVETDQMRFSGQTWDMHKAARDYLCILEIPEIENVPKQFIMTVVGCVGLTGFSEYGNYVGVNNLRTCDAVSGIIWPCLVRKMLKSKNITDMRNILTESEVTSAHTYMIGDSQQAEMWEISPQLKSRQNQHIKGHSGVMFHTNHCLTEEGKILEQKHLSKTTHARYNLLEKKIGKISDEAQLRGLLTDHENYPDSICTHDPHNKDESSETCGGALYNLKAKSAYFWRGCDKNQHLFIEHTMRFK